MSDGSPAVPAQERPGHAVSWPGVLRPGAVGIERRAGSAGTRSNFRKETGPGDDRSFARAVGLSVAGHLVVAALLAPLVASSAVPTPDLHPSAQPDVSYTMVLVDAPAEAVLRDAPVEEFSAPVPADEHRDAAPLAEESPAVRELVQAEPERVDAARDLSVTPVILAFAAPSPAPAAPISVAPPLPSTDALSGGRGGPESDRGVPGAADRPERPRDGDAGGSAPEAVRGASATPLDPARPDPARATSPAGTAPASAASDLLAAYRGRVAAWLQPRVQRRFIADPEGRALDAAALAVVQMQLAVDAAGRARVLELASPTPALERIVRDVLSAGSLPLPPAALGAPVSLRMRIRFTLL